MDDLTLTKASSSHSSYSQPSTSKQGISTISDRVSMGSGKSYCSGVLINGQMCCCQKALHVTEHSTSQTSISSVASSSSNLTNKTERTKETRPKISFELSHLVERELKMGNPKTINREQQREESLEEVVTKL